MEHYAGIDMSLEQSSVCVVDGIGRIIREAKVASESEVLVAWFEALNQTPVQIGLEAGPLSQWLHVRLAAAGFEMVLLETGHVKAALSAMTTTTDRMEARGIARMVRIGWNAFPVRVAPGRRWVYHSTDTHLATAAMVRFLKQRTGGDLFDLMLAELYRLLGLSRGFAQTIRDGNSPDRPRRANPSYTRAIKF